jgi:hypothetical protein
VPSASRDPRTCGMGRTRTPSAFAGKTFGHTSMPSSGHPRPTCGMRSAGSIASAPTLAKLRDLVWADSDMKQSG